MKITISKLYTVFKCVIWCIFCVKEIPYDKIHTNQICLKHQKAKLGFEIKKLFLELYIKAISIAEDLRSSFPRL